jgi:hypothetical protein
MKKYKKMIGGMLVGKSPQRTPPQPLLGAEREGEIGRIGWKRLTKHNINGVAELWSMPLG